MPRRRRYGRADLPVGLDARQRVPAIRIPNAAGATRLNPPRRRSRPRPHPLAPHPHQIPHLIQQLFGLTRIHASVIQTPMKKHKACFPVTPLISDIRETFPSN